MKSPFRLNRSKIKNFDKVRDELVSWFIRCGYIRQCDPERRTREGRSYKKGYEVRFVLQAIREVITVRRLLKKMGLRGGAPFEKHSRIVLPVYGREAVRWFVEHLGSDHEERGFGPDGRRLIPRPRVRNRKPS